MNKACFLDRDGTINIDKNYLYRKEDFEFLLGAVDGLRMIQNNGFKLIIITNQSGIAKDYYSEADFHVLSDWMANSLSKQGISIEKVYYCPHHPEASNHNYGFDCNCRKPKLGLFEKAIKEFNIDLSKSYAIGDKLRDCEICKVSECRGFLIGLSENPQEIQRVRNGKVKRIRYAENLLECAKLILNDG